MSERPVRVVVVGCGGMGTQWIKLTLAAPQLELVGLVDQRRSQAEAVAAKLELSPSMVYDTLDDALAQAKPEAVFDVTIPEAHHDVTLTALRAGCHVLGEKPMADTLDRARAMVAAAAQADLHYAVTQSRRPDPNVLSVTQFLASGALGAVQEVHCDFFLGPHFSGFRDEMAHPLLVDMAIHTFDNARQIAAADPLSVFCKTFNPQRSWYTGDASAVALFDMTGPAGERIVYNYRGSWCAEGLGTSWNAQWRIVCVKGTLLWDGEQDIRAERVVNAEPRKFFADVESVDVPRVVLEHTGHDYLLRQFASCVRNGQQPMCPCADNIKSLAMVFAAVRSAESGRVEQVAW